MTQPLAKPAIPALVADIGADAGQLALRTVTVQSFDASTGVITITIGGVDRTAYYLKSYSPTIGDIAYALRNGAAWLVLGKAAP